MAGGGGSPVQNAMAQVDDAKSSRYTGPTSGAAYTPVKANIYSPTFSNDQKEQTQMGLSPLVQEMQQNSQISPFQAMGLGVLANSLFSQLPQTYSPLQRGLPTYSASALNYRPNMSGIAANLRNVAPPVTYEQTNPTPPEIAAGGGE